ncbi:MAG: hypothetical protein TREMPRED_000858 [Tremellales sp. Tagirdzhanova-0007]|nr:MAG: hypothetical protein TREMPRED_000858 [Tremellales sp. Tagirdzhanova-0007]
MLGSSSLYSNDDNTKDKGKARADSTESTSNSFIDDLHWRSARENERWSTSTIWRESRARAKSDRRSWDYVLSSGVAGGIAGCVVFPNKLMVRGDAKMRQAKTAIAPLDRVKILFQTSNAEFRKYAGTPMGLLNATGTIYRQSGIRGLFQGHSATLLRIFPYAGIKFMTYDWIESILIPSPEKRTMGRFFLSEEGVTSVLITYPLELIRVRLAFQTRDSERTSLRQAIRSINHEAKATTSSPSSTATSRSGISSFTRSIPFYPFYRGFSITILGMIPYAGVSFLTYGTLKRYAAILLPPLATRPTTRDLSCGAVAGAVSQSASYPFEVVRRRMQVGGARGGSGINWRDAIRGIYEKGGWRGFFVGLSIGYLKVIPMTSISFATWQLMKRAMEI